MRMSTYCFVCWTKFPSSIFSPPSIGFNFSILCFWRNCNACFVYSFFLHLKIKRSLFFNLWILQSKWATRWWWSPLISSILALFIIIIWTNLAWSMCSWWMYLIGLFVCSMAMAWRFRSRISSYTPFIHWFKENNLLFPVLVLSICLHAHFGLIDFFFN